VAAFAVYTGVEAAAGAWSYSLLALGRGYAMALAAGAVSAFWGGLTLGRLIAGALARTLAPRTILAASLGGMLAGAGLLWLEPVAGAAPIGLALLGLACAPVFPTLIASTPARVGAARADAAVGLQVAGAAIGQAGLPALIGVAIAALGLEVVPVALFASVLLLTGLCALLERSSPASPPAPCAPSPVLGGAARADSPR
jgi:fucose permease